MKFLNTNNCQAGIKPMTHLNAIEKSISSSASETVAGHTKTSQPRLEVWVAFFVMNLGRLICTGAMLCIE
jgi:hypothetical protein